MLILGLALCLYCIDAIAIVNDIFALVLLFRRSKMPPKIPFKPPVTPARSNQALKTSRDKDPVEVYCRLRPLETGTEESCITILNDTTVQVVPPETSQGYRSGTTKV